MLIIHLLNYSRIYFQNSLRRHIFLLAILALSFAIITSVTTITQGMITNITHAAEFHYGGHLFLLGLGASKHLVPEPEKIIAAARSSGLAFNKAVLRTQDYIDGILYFGGSSLKQKYVFGIDWEAERESFQRQDLLAGDFTKELPPNGIIISSSTAAELRLRLNDDVILEVNTLTGQKNTARLVVWGIIEDKSIFGYFKCYISRQTANSLLGFKEDECSWIGLYFDQSDPVFLKGQATKLFNALKTGFPLTSIVNSREELSRELRSSHHRLEIAVVTLTAYISQVSELLEAIRLLSYFLYSLMVLIALSSLIVSYRLILHERIEELGTMRVFGLSQGSLVLLLLGESLFVYALSFILGLLLAFGLNELLAMFSYDWIPGFDILLEKGKLSASYKINIFLTNIFIVFFTTIPAVVFLAIKVAQADLIKVLKGEAL